MVTSFRARSPHITDDTVLTTVRAVSDLSELYYDFTEYRLDLLKERIGTQVEALHEARKRGKKFATANLKAFLQGQAKFLEHMDKEIVFEAEVMAGKAKVKDLAEASIEKLKKRARV